MLGQHLPSSHVIGSDGPQAGPLRPLPLSNQCIQAAPAWPLTVETENHWMALPSSPGPQYTLSWLRSCPPGCPGQMAMRIPKVFQKEGVLSGDPASSRVSVQRCFKDVWTVAPDPAPVKGEEAAFPLLGTRDYHIGTLPSLNTSLKCALFVRKQHVWGPDILSK